MKKNCNKMQAVNEICNRKEKTSSPQCIIADEITHVTASSIASVLKNSYFASIGKILADKIKPVPFSSTNKHSGNFENFELKEIHEVVVLEFLKALKTHKAIGQHQHKPIKV